MNRVKLYEKRVVWFCEHRCNEPVQSSGLFWTDSVWHHDESLRMSSPKVRSLKGSLTGMPPAERQSRRFNDDIAGTDCAKEVLRKCVRHRTQFSAVHLVTALHRVAKAENGLYVTDEPVFTTLVEEVAEVCCVPGPGSSRHASNADWILSVPSSKCEPSVE